MWKLLRMISYISLIMPSFIFQIIWSISNIFNGRVGALIRYVLIAKRVKRCGNRVYIGPYVSIINMAHLEIGNNVSIHHQCTLICNGGIKLNDNVSIAHGCSLVSTNHTWDDQALPIKYNIITKSKINIKSDVWIGCGVRILAGSTINSRSIVAAGAVVAGSELESHSIYGGIPCKKIKSIL